ncbi:hypothetical protein HYT24_03245 [Candidatus Pacearchaeota archaeon]|nr:hypothetical protein [Candidatus Pacearchaeota archaeon]
MPKRDVQNTDNSNVEKILIENFVSLQRVMTNLSVKFDDLTRQLTKLLELFEISAKTIAEKKHFGDKEMTDKLNNLVEQNKTLAKGITLLHEANRTPSRPQQPQMRPNIPQSSKQTVPNPVKKKPEEEYTKSESPNKKDDINF